MNIKNLLDLVADSAKGIDNIKDGAVGSNGYGFVFRKFDYYSQETFLICEGSSKLCSIGAFRDIYKKFLNAPNQIKNPEQLLNYDPKLDLYFGGALKTMISDIEFGGYESLFDIWMLVKTPESKMFPATLYYGLSGLIIGSWCPGYRDFLPTDARDFPDNFKRIINSNPFDFSIIEMEEFIEGLLFALNKVPISDFEGEVQYDFGTVVMGIKSGKPFIDNLANDIEYRQKKVETWSYSIMGNSQAWDFESHFLKIALSHLTPKEDKKYPKNVPDDLLKILIERSYDRLVSYAYKTNSRLAFMVLGQFLMLYGCKMTEELKHEILRYSDWEYEKHMVKNPKDKEERKKFLDDFNNKIRMYDGSMKIVIPIISKTHIINEKRVKGDKIPDLLPNIEYSIKSPVKMCIKNNFTD